ncbi:alpha/beta hydrolase [Corynebacterium sp. sy039]|uniref:alpha/beta hydrolase n=1 Tax=Corynebacterium sp. sy039 TaxID=2599641 RepID=UPI00143D608F|nr:alpha/beta hydrolase [Corynebacterium sp. sy039]
MRRKKTEFVFNSATIAQLPQQWEHDILGEDFAQLVFNLDSNVPTTGTSPQNPDKACATLIHYAPTKTAPSSQKPATTTAMLWVHGLTDYFFHEHIAQFFATHGYAFYALDLRKCGRSYRPGQKWHHTNDIEQYFEELTLAAHIILSKHDFLIPIAHSTGGLIVVLWLDYLRRSHPLMHKHIRGAILNSPWLDMIIPAIASAPLKPLLSVSGKYFPDIALPSSSNHSYGQSLHISAQGEWNYDLTYKPMGGHKKYLDWLRSIMLGQQRIHRRKVDCGVPVLTLCSTQSYFPRAFDAQCTRSDVILNVAQIQKWAKVLSTHTRVAPIAGAVHDVFLSKEYARTEALRISLQWLRDLG